MSEEQPKLKECRICGAAVGQLHDLYCTLERCPFCLGQLAGCDCKATVLQLDDDERRAVDEFVDDTVEPLKGIMKRWEEVLDKEGRIPFQG